MRISKDRIDLDDKVLQKPVLKDYGETVVTANSSTAYTCDLTEGNVFDITLTGNCSFTFSNPPASGTAGSFTLILTQDGTGSRTVTWPSAVTWFGGAEPTMETGAYSENILTFYTLDAGTTWYGALSGSINNTLSSVSFFASAFDNNTADSTDWSITLPASIEDGDLGIIYTTVDQNRTDNPSTHPPTGWTVLGTTQGVDSEYPECWVYGKLLTSSEASSTVTITGQVSDSHSTAAIVFRGDVPISTFSSAQDFNSEDGASALTLCDTDPSGETTAISVCLAYSCGRPITPQYPTLSSSPAEDGQEASPTTGQRISYHIFNGSGHTAIDNSVTDTGRQVGVAFYLNLT